MSKQLILSLLPFLSLNECQDLLVAISTHVFENQFVSLSSQIKEERYANGHLICPFCQTHRVVKNGKRKTVQRYLCRECDKSFSSQTQTASAYSKKTPDCWLNYMNCLIAGHSLRKCSEVCEISLPTAFYWRHKILEALKSFSDVREISGLVEADECFFRFSKKGEKKDKFEARSQNKKRGISSEQVAVGTALDRNGHFMFGLLGRGRPTFDSIKRLFDGRIQKNSILCTDSAPYYKKLSEELNLNHIKLAPGQHKQDIYHINHINACHQKLKQFMFPFKGVATKHLEHYLYYFKWLEEIKDENEPTKSSKTYIKTHSAYSKATKSDITNRKPAYV